MLKSDKIWHRYLVTNCVSLRTFWTTLVSIYVNVSRLCACLKWLTAVMMFLWWCVFVKVHVYECHGKPQGLRHVTPRAKFTCKHCGSSASSLAAHCSHLAHHQSPSAELVRIFSCVYCDCRSDNIEVLEEHVACYHPNKPMKFEVQQSSITYLQASLSRAVCRIIF